MPNSSSLLAYPDVKAALEQALTSNYGVKVIFKTKAEAHRFLGRCTSFRLLSRKENLKVYPEPAHSLHGRSVYDGLSIKCNDTDVFIIPLKESDVVVEILQG